MDKKHTPHTRIQCYSPLGKSSVLRPIYPFTKDFLALKMLRLMFLFAWVINTMAVKDFLMVAC